MMNKKILVLLAFIVISLTASGQDSDFGIWTEVSASRKVTTRIKGEVSVAVRTFENISKVEQYFGEAGLTYKLNDYFSGTAAYRLSSSLENDGKYYFRHKTFFDFIGSYPAGRLEISARLRMQMASRTYLEDPDDDPRRYHARFRLKALYDVQASKFSPFISIESFIPVARGDGFEISKYRISLGSAVKISTKSSLDIAYLLEHDTRPDLINTHIISVGWNLKF